MTQGTSPDLAPVIESLVADAAPARRLWPVRVRLAVWLASVAALAAGVTAAAHRPDLVGVLEGPAYLVELATLAALAALLAFGALSAAIPGAEVRRGTWRLTIALAASAAVLALRQSSDADVTVRAFIAHGLPCVSKTVLFALVPWALLLAMLRRGAPLDGTGAGALAGGAAFVAAFLMLRLVCASDERLHIACWHDLPVGVGVLLSVLIGMVWLPRWRARRVGGA